MTGKANNPYPRSYRLDTPSASGLGSRSPNDRSNGCSTGPGAAWNPRDRARARPEKRRTPWRRERRLRPPATETNGWPATPTKS